MFVARRRLCLEARGEHERALSGLHLWNWIELYQSIRVFRDCQIIFKRWLLCDHEVHRESYAVRAPTLSSWRTRTAVRFTQGERRGSLWQRGGKLTRTESVARWSREGRAAYEADRKALLFDFFISSPVQGVPNGRKLIPGTREGRFFSFRIFGFIFIVFAVLLCRAGFSLSYIQHIARKKYLPYLGYVRTYGMRRSGWMEHGAFGICKSPVCIYLLKQLFGPSVPFHSRSACMYVGTCSSDV